MPFLQELMGELEEAGWRKQKPKKVKTSIPTSVMINLIISMQTKDITEMDIKAIFRLVDVDKSGNISRTVS